MFCVIKHCMSKIQEDDTRRVQIYILDGVCAPNVGPCLGAGVCWPCCVLCSKAIYQQASCEGSGPVLLDGRHTGPSWLVDGQEWLAGLCYCCLRTMVNGVLCDGRQFRKADAGAVPWHSMTIPSTPACVPGFSHRKHDSMCINCFISGSIS